MTLYETWQQMSEMQTTEEAQLAYWNEYFAAETENYKMILTNHETPYSGKLSELAEEFDMPTAVFAGFMDGINDSLKNGYDIETLTEETDVELDVDFEKLFYNMHEAKAKWLYTLEEWEEVLPQEERQRIAKEWRMSKQVIKSDAEKVGRNDPCPCGSGKKFKKCCGKAS